MPIALGQRAIEHRAVLGTGYSIMISYFCEEATRLCPGRILIFIHIYTYIILKNARYRIFKIAVPMRKHWILMVPFSAQRRL